MPSVPLGNNLKKRKKKDENIAFNEEKSKGIVLT